MSNDERVPILPPLGFDGPLPSAISSSVGLALFVTYPNGRVKSRQMTWDKVIELVESAPDHEGNLIDGHSDRPLGPSAYWNAKLRRYLESDDPEWSVDAFEAETGLTWHELSGQPMPPPAPEGEPVPGATKIAAHKT